MIMLIVSKEMIVKERFEAFVNLCEREGIKLNRNNVKELKDFNVCKVTTSDLRNKHGFDCYGVNCGDCSKELFEEYPNIFDSFFKESNIGVLK